MAHMFSIILSSDWLTDCTTCIYREIYDASYLSYLRVVLSLLPQFGLTVFVALHQDIWSCYASGSGTPVWMLAHVGFDLHALKVSSAAWLHGMCGGGHSEAECGLWPCDYQKLTAATMACILFITTMPFYGHCWLVSRSCCCCTGCASGLATWSLRSFMCALATLMVFLGLKCVCLVSSWSMLFYPPFVVISVQMMNEPHKGYIDLPSLYKFKSDYNTDLHLGHIRAYIYLGAQRSSAYAGQHAVDTASAS